jgi:uncharacterized RmlC-like cupin family protein
MRLSTRHLSLALVLLCRSGREARAQAFEVGVAKIHWTALSPMDTAVRYAILRVDSVSGATQMLYRFPPSTTLPCHWHTASQGTMVLQGSLTWRRPGLTEGATLGVGGYTYVPAGMPFQLTTGPTVTIVMASLDGALDTHVVKPDQCRSATPGGGVAAARAFEIDSQHIPWVNFPTKDSPVRIATLRVDSTSGATHMLFRIPPNDTSPCHWHTAAEHNVVVQGSASMRHPGMGEGPMFGVAGFSFVPRRMPHQILTGPTTMVVFSTLDGRFDFHAVDDAQCQR